MKIDKDAMLELARTRLSDALTADRENRIEAKSDLEHIAGIQWDEDIKATREASGRPCLTINRLPQFVRQVTGDIRRLNPAIRVYADDGDATEGLADLHSAIIRGIEYGSRAQGIYEGAAESAAQCGMGHWRILTEYEGDDSFNQIIKLERIHNPFAVYWDPAARESTRCDADWCMIAEQMPEDKFEEEYPEAEKSSVEIDRDINGLEAWYTNGSVTVAEYYWKEPVEKTIGLMADGSIIEDPTAAHNVIKKRKVHTHKIMWAKISAKEVLEEPQEIPGMYIPVIAVMGEEIWIGDKIVRNSVIRYARDPQRMYNYWRSASTEMIALQPKTPFMVTAHQIKGQEAAWAAANDSNDAYLIYSPDPKAPPPQRSQPPVPSSGMFQEIMAAADDMKATTGIYDAGLGNQSNEKSGVAIRQRQMESDISTSIYTDNLGKSIEHCGRIIVSMIPKVYDTNRLLTVVDDEDKEQLVEVNGKVITPEGMADVNPLNRGRYSVRVSVGPNYATRRQETQEGMMKFIQAVPAAGQFAADLIAKAADWPDSDKLAERLKKMLPPQLQDEQDNPQMMAMQQQAAQAQQVAQQMAMQGQQVELRKANAEATEAEAKASEAQTDALTAQMELAMKDGTMNAAISQLVQVEVARALQGALQRGLIPIN